MCSGRIIFHALCSLCGRSNAVGDQPSHKYNAHACVAFVQYILNPPPPPPSVGVLFCSTVREAAQDCLQEMYRVLGPVLVDSLTQQGLRPAVLRDLATRLDQVAPTNLLALLAATSPDGGAGGGVVQAAAAAAAAGDCGYMSLSGGGATFMN